MSDISINELKSLEAQLFTMDDESYMDELTEEQQSLVVGAISPGVSVVAASALRITAATAARSSVQCAGYAGGVVGMSVGAIWGATTDEGKK